MRETISSQFSTCFSFGSRILVIQTKGIQRLSVGLVMWWPQPKLKFVYDCLRKQTSQCLDIFQNETQVTFLKSQL